MNNRSLLPDLMLGGFAEVTPALLCEMGIRALVCDIDNTLVTYDDPQPTEPLMEWFSEMARAGVKIAFVSNNDEARVEGFNRQLGYVAFADAGKPHPKKIKLAIGRNVPCWAIRFSPTCWRGGWRGFAVCWCRRSRIKRRCSSDSSARWRCRF